MLKIPLLVRILLLLIALGIFCEACLMGMVAWKETHVPPLEGYDLIIVLGAQVKADGSLSVQLTDRLQAALDTWQRKHVPIICCGGQGSNEPAPQGEVMRNWLIAHGVPEDMVTADITSVNTRQNLENAITLMNGQLAKVCIVTSDYHLPRSMAIAKDAGLEVTGVGSATKPEYWLKNHAREAIAWCKYWVEKYTSLKLD